MNKKIQNQLNGLFADDNGQPSSVSIGEDPTLTLTEKLKFLKAYLRDVKREAKHKLQWADEMRSLMR